MHNFEDKKVKEIGRRSFTSVLLARDNEEEVVLKISSTNWPQICFYCFYCSLGACICFLGLMNITQHNDKSGIKLEYSTFVIWTNLIVNSPVNLPCSESG